MVLKIKNMIFGILYILVLVYLLIFVPSFWGYKPLVVISRKYGANSTSWLFTILSSREFR